MSFERASIAAAAAAILAGCAGSPQHGTLAELEHMPADVEDVMLEDGLERAAESYRRYLEETAEGRLTPEAMRRLADLQIEQEYGVLGTGGAPVEMAAPAAGERVAAIGTAGNAARSGGNGESEDDFERRASGREELLASMPAATRNEALPGQQAVPAGPREAIETYRKILEMYPDYERNDQVLYQMSRAYDEIGQPDDAMTVMDRLVREYPHSKYVDEVHFRRGEYYFVRSRYLDAEEAYGDVIGIGERSQYYELALYKLGWSLYKQELYEDALHRFVSMLDYRESIGYDFDEVYAEGEEHRVTDTFRVISLSFSNLGGPEVVDEYFDSYGERRYADKVYANLGEFYFDKLRYEDAASVYRSFVQRNPVHAASPHFSMRTVEIYTEAGFPQKVVEAKKDFARRYALDAAYWQHRDVAEAPEVLGFLKTNLKDLAGHYHALYQADALAEEKPGNFAEAEQWYRQYLASFPEAGETPGINYQLADLLLENEDFGVAAGEYERTAYAYGEHEQAAAAGYAAIYAHRQDLDAASGARITTVRQATVQSSLRFADTFPGHDQAAAVLGAAADDLYGMQEFAAAIAAAQKLIARYPDAEPPLRRSAWAVIAHSSIDLAEYVQAEDAYLNLLALTPAGDESRTAVVDGLAAAIYKQGEQANLLEDYRAAAEHFLRIGDVAPGSRIRAAAEYDAAAAYVKLEDWAASSAVLEEFRSRNPDHELNHDATRQLAHIYREDGQIARSAAEHERIAAEAGDADLAREALLTAAELYDEAGVVPDTIRVYEQYLDAYPEPLDIAMESRTRLAEIFKAEGDWSRYYPALEAVVEQDRAAGAARTDRSRFLAAGAALVLAELTFEDFGKLELTQPFEDSLAKKQALMDTAMRAFEGLVEYQVAEVTAAATYYIAEIYLEFSNALLDSERPADLGEAEMADYEMVIEEEAFPFEERSIDVHQKNFELLAAGIYNPWIQRSLDKLALLMPGRYAKAEISGGYVGSIDSYAYRMPNAPPPIDESAGDAPKTADAGIQPEPAARIAPGDVP